MSRQDFYIDLNLYILSPFEHPARIQMVNARYANFTGWQSYRHSQEL